MSDDPVEKRAQRQFYKSFALWFVLSIAGYFAWGWIRTAPAVQNVPWPFRKSYAWNQKVTEFFYRPDEHAPEFPLERARMPKVNGMIGIDDDGFDPKAWKLNVEVGEKKFALNIDDIKALPHYEMVTQLKCVEGWSEIVHWGGARLSEFMRKYGLVSFSNPPTKSELFKTLDTIGMETPNDDYYVGIDMATAMNDQTLLAYEMDGKPLTLEHGAPLRLVTPLKYGIKNIKRIGKIFVEDAAEAADYWAELGYDWHSGH